ncbi:MAG: type IV secretory system conjugative DNA transfer family protein [Clostridiaceae bacterium]|nr:type IV secretory system conjugative DNA transfer family protein [Clostridiaceae bacterium]
MIFCFGLGGIYLLAQIGYVFDTVLVLHDQPNIIEIFNSFESNLSEPHLIKDNLLSLNKDTYTFKFTFLGIFTCLLWILYTVTTRKKYRKGKEYGSARWGTAKEALKLSDKKNKNNNIILTNDIQMSLNTYQTQKNLNVLVIGSSGSGKTRFYVKPNLMQMNTSYIITDPKGELLRSCGKMLEKNGYNVKVFNLINMKNSCNYNPFAYLQDADGKYSDSNVVKLINVLMKNTKKEGQSNGDQFWEDSAEALLLALSFYLIYEGNRNEKNFATVIGYFIFNQMPFEKFIVTWFKMNFNPQKRKFMYMPVFTIIRKEIINDDIKAIRIESEALKKQNKRKPGKNNMSKKCKGAS